MGPSLLPPTPELRARAALASRILDLYIVPIQVGVGVGLGEWQGQGGGGRPG